MKTQRPLPDPGTRSRFFRTSRASQAVIAALILVVVAVAAWWTIGGSNDALAGVPDHADHVDHSGQDVHDAHGSHGAHGGQETGGTDAGSIQLDPGTAHSLGITLVAAELGPLRRTIRTTGHVAYDETRLTTVAPRFSGFVERLHVDFTGQAVRTGQPLLEIYSPELVAAQEELLAAARMERQLRSGGSEAALQRATTLLEAARRRLLLWQVSPAQLRQIESSGEVLRALTLHATAGGFVVEKLVQAGQAVDTGMPLYRLADLSSVWVEADVYEQDLRFVRIGERAEVEIAAYPGERFPGRVSYVYPEVRMETRTARVRVQLPNAGGRIKPGMFATVMVDAPAGEDAVLVPRDAVMHSGTHAMVFVGEGEGRFRAREVQVGAEIGGRTQILSGLTAGEQVVQRANFLLDSESRLMDVMGGMPGMDH